MASGKTAILWQCVQLKKLCRRPTLAESLRSVTCDGLVTLRVGTVTPPHLLQLWISRISIAARAHGFNYSLLMNRLVKVVGTAVQH